MPGSLTLHGPILTGGRELPPSRVVVRDGRIQSVQSTSRPNGADLVVSDGWIAPGLIDLQVNGAGGIDLTSASEPEEAIAAVSGVLARHGVTSFCPTVVSSPRDGLPARLTAYRPRVWAEGAESLGLHVEGPFLNPEYRGVHERELLRTPDVEELREWSRTGLPTMVTLAPEVPGAIRAIRVLVDMGVVVSLGHSGADAATAREGLAAGATMGTHFFNGMSPFHHRRPGLVGALLTSTATIGLIADGLHVDPIAVDIVLRAAGVERVALVSDALAAAAAPAGSSVLGDQKVLSDGRLVRRLDGTMAGSAVLLDQGLRNVRAWLPWLPPAQAMRLCTETPARALGPRVARRKGRIARGYDADLVILDREWRVRATIVRGEIVSAASSSLTSIP